MATKDYRNKLGEKTTLRIGGVMTDAQLIEELFDLAELAVVASMATADTHRHKLLMKSLKALRVEVELRRS